jgi:hypothetical protein
LDIYKIIHKGENSRTEFKSADFHNDSLAKEITAFSNMSGGDIFIGISGSIILISILTANISKSLCIISRSKSFPRIRFYDCPGVQKLYFARLRLPVDTCKNTIFALLRKLFDLLIMQMSESHPAKVYEKGAGRTDCYGTERKR